MVAMTAGPQPQLKYFPHKIIKYVVDIESEQNCINNKRHIKYQLHVSATN